MPTLRNSQIRPLPKVGTLIASKYRVQGVLGTGGMGGVLLAMDETLGREVALKVVLPHLIEDEAARDRFQKEAHAMAAVVHPRVVRIFDYGEHEAAPFFVMQYIKGETLRERMDRLDQPMSIDEAIGLLTEICHGVAAIHQASIVHGDIKPSNILIGRDHQPRVSDFGVTGGSLGLGTPGYMSPERQGATQLTPAHRFLGDVYSLGVLAFELLSGVPLFDGRGAQILMQQLYKELPIPSQVRPDLPASFDEVVLAALQPDPDNRTPSVIAFSQDIRRGFQNVPRRAMRHLLIVDDEPSFVEIVTAIATEELSGVKVVGVSSGKAALAAVRAQRFHAVVLDLQMPEMNGLELTALLREECGKDTHILVATGQGAANDRDVLLRLGASDFVVKPIEPVSFTIRLRRALGLTR